MLSSHIHPRVGIFTRLYWLVAYKYRKITLLTIFLLIVFSSIKVYWDFLLLQKRVAVLQVNQAKYVLKINKDLNVGDQISFNDLAIAKIFADEFASYASDLEKELHHSSVFVCDNQASLSSCQNIIGRVVKIPLYKNSILRQEFFAESGVEPGIINLLDTNQAFLDLTVPQTGFNIYLKPNDFVDLYKIEKDFSHLISKKAKIVMIDALPLGKAPLQVKVEPSLVRNLTIAVDKKDLFELTNAVREKKVYVTLHNNKDTQVKNSQYKSKTKNNFQQLTLIQGHKKEIVTK